MSEVGKEGISQNPILDELAQINSAGTGEAQEIANVQSTTRHDEQPTTEEPQQSSEQPSESFDDSVNEEVELESQTDNVGDSEVPETDSTSQDESPTEDTPWFEKEDDNWTNEKDETDYSALIKDLGIEGSAKSDIISSYTTLQEKNQELEEKVKTFEETNPYANDDLKAANDLAKSGGDWKQYLNISSTDWDQIDDTTLVVEMKLRDVFGDNVEAMQEHLQKMGEYEIKIQGNQIREGLKADQQAKMQAIQKKAEDKQREINNQIKNTLDNVNEMYGVKLTPALKSQMYKEITSPGGLINKIFYDKNGNLNPKAIISTAFAASNMKMIMQVNMNRYMNKGKEQLLNEVSNPKTKNNGEFSNPNSKPKSALDGFMDHLKNSGPY